LLWVFVALDFLWVVGERSVAESIVYHPRWIFEGIQS
jgi:hypothetical protein